MDWLEISFRNCTREDLMNILNILFQLTEVQLNDIPNNCIIDAKIIMHNNVSEILYLPPVNSNV